VEPGNHRTKTCLAGAGPRAGRREEEIRDRKNRVAHDQKSERGKKKSNADYKKGAKEREEVRLTQGTRE